MYWTPASSKIQHTLYLRIQKRNTWAEAGVLTPKILPKSSESHYQFYISMGSVTSFQGHLSSPAWRCVVVSTVCLSSRGVCHRACAPCRSSQMCRVSPPVCGVCPYSRVWRHVSWHVRQVHVASRECGVPLSSAPQFALPSSLLVDGPRATEPQITMGAGASGWVTRTHPFQWGRRGRA